MTGAAARMTAESTIGAWCATNNSRKSYHRLKVDGSRESMWAPLVKVNHFWLRPGEMRDQCWTMPARLLVLPLAGQKDRHLDLVDEGIRVQGVGDCRVVVRVGSRSRTAGWSLRREGLGWRHMSCRRFGSADTPTAVRWWARPVGVLLALLRPGHREACVEDAAREQRRRRRIDGRQRRDRLEGGRIELRYEQLADRAVGDAHHPDLVVQDPRLVGNGLYDVIPVEILQRLEEVERPTRATGATHVDVDHGESHEICENSDPILRSGGIRVPIARIFDKRRVGRKVVSGAIR